MAKLLLKASVLMLFSTLSLVLATSGLSAMKPSASQFDSVQSAARTALNSLGLVDQRGCDADHPACIVRATSAESATFLTASKVMSQVVKRLSSGKCRAALTTRAAGYARRASLVTRAADAWASRRYVDAARLYYRTKWNPSLRLDGLFLKYC